MKEALIGSPEMKKIIFYVLGAAVLVVGFFAVSIFYEPAEPYDPVPIKTTDETQYLLFFPPVEGIYEATNKEKTFQALEEKAADTAAARGESNNHG